jgi:uncharacterized damage-inducible protein DinB
MDAAYFLRQFDYNNWANQRMLEVFANASNQGKNLPEIALDGMSHILGAQEIWLRRLTQRSGGKELFALKPLDELIPLSKQSGEEWKNFIQAHAGDLEHFRLDYEMLDGSAQSSSLTDIITHVCNHGTYHRGQVSKSLKAAGIQPLSTDFIVYSRL